MNNNLRSRMFSRTASTTKIRAHKSLNSVRPKKVYRPQRLKNWQVALSSLWRSQTALGTIAAFSSTFCLMVGGVSMSLELMMNPEGVKWLEPLIPHWSQVPFANREAPQTLKAIQAQISVQGLIPVRPLVLDKLPSPQTNEGLWSYETGILVPVMARCAQTPESQGQDCQKIVQLQLYLQVRSPEYPDDAQIYYQKISQLNIDGPAESYVISHLNDSDFNGSSQPLPLTQLERFYSQAPHTGIWFQLSGQKTYNQEKIKYGKIVHYNYETRYLSEMIQWASANNQPPVWQEVTGGGHPELIIDRTTGIEPNLSIYQIQPVKFVVNPINLEEITLNTPALTTQRYRDALWLAKTGLWSPAWEMMALEKQSLGIGNWTAAAQAQMDVIRFHAQVSQVQANARWRNPSQQVLMALVDGRWTQALEIWKSQLALGNTMNDVLNTDQVDLWSRVEMALRVNPKNIDLQAWGALIIAAQDGEWQAKDWLAQQSASPEERKQLLDLLEKRSQAIKRSQKINRHRSRIIGNGLILSEINPEQWLPGPGASLTLEPNHQIWYQIEVIRFHDSLVWQEFPFNDLQLPRYQGSDYLWKYLGLHNDPNLQIIVWMPNGEQQAVTATVKALQFQNGVLRLLAAGKPLPETDPTKIALTGNGEMSKPLAVSNSALEWRSPQILTLKQLNQQNPQWVNAILPVLWYELQLGGEVLPGLQPSPEMMLTQMSDWLVQLVDLTGNDKPEAILTLKPDPTRKYSRPRTLILEDTGALIYSELTSAKGQAVTGIADVKDGGFTALVVEGSQGYTLQRWSSERRRFEF